jgi:hypothetical protein
MLMGLRVADFARGCSLQVPFPSAETLVLMLSETRRSSDSVRTRDSPDEKVFVCLNEQRMSIYLISFRKTVKTCVYI